MWALQSLRRSLPRAAASSSSLHRWCGVPSISPPEGFAARGGAGEAASVSGALVPAVEGGGGGVCRRLMSTTKGRSMRSKVEKRMARETGRTQRELRRAVKLRKKLMTDDERLIHSMRRAKKKVALLLQKLKKYELPDLPAPRHDPELLTAEQLQAYKKIGFRNRNYVPVGVRGVFGGVVQNMHMHWKFHETVQVCCDNFPKEKIKEMAAMLTRLSGGIVVNIHNTKTIIMFRGRNYRQPKNLIPFNTLTKRKALFKARYEQALESQKLNIKKIETQLRRKGINPEDPVAMASIQRVASTFFRAIDEQQGTPYVFRGDAQPTAGTTEIKEPHDQQSEDSEQEELDHFIAEIESAAEKQWEEEEAAEKEETSRLQYRYREEMGDRRGFNRSYDNSDADDRNQGRYRRDNNNHNKWTSDSRRWDDDSEIEASGEDVDNHSGFSRRYDNSDREDRSQGRYRRGSKNIKRTTDSRRSDDESEASGEDWDSDDGRDGVVGFDNARDTPDEHPRRFESMRHERSRSTHRQNYMPGASRNSSRTLKNSVSVSDDSGDDHSDTEDDEVWGSDYKEGTNSRDPKVIFPNYHSGSEEDTDDNWKHGGKPGQIKKNTDEDWDSD
ncbi:CRM-domain containing factor CFM3, chloroplastic/mitochondrial [Brachypodium distachyon]|nr:CRM-domain containing factor CFM3, chloroplastic/mitochondrial [Brachypodium distachyon]|eukprot:XP_010231725.1 CRM-domain containing factor CFM3, chloroplastic/mitochondrial [Brachypodium distachyon]